MRISDDIEDLCRKLKPEIGIKADKLWHFYLSENEKGRKDVALDIEILAEKILKGNPLEKQKILLEPPAQKDSPGKFHVGDVVYNQKKFQSLYLRPEDFIKQVGIFAVTGEGKTNLAYLLTLQLLRDKIPFLVIDWKRSWRNLLSLQDQFPELKKVQVYTVGRDILPFYWNPFRAPPNSDKQLWISTISETLEKSHLSGPGVAYYFNRIYSTLVKSLPSDDFNPNFFDGLREIQKIKAYQRELKWKQTALRIFQSFTTGNAAKVFNVRDPLKLENLLGKSVILELDFEMPKPLRNFFSEIILRWIHLYRLSQGETENLRHVLFLEEAHNLFGAQATHAYWDANLSSLENIYREIRAFGQGIVSITQHPSLLPIYVLGNCHTQIYLGLQHANDVAAARKALFLAQDEESYLNLLKVGESIIKIRNRVDPCHVKIPLVPIQKGQVTDEWLRVNTPPYLQENADEEKPEHPGYLPNDIYKGYQQGKHHQNAKPHLKLLSDIFLEPFSTTVKRYKRLKFNPKYGNQFKNQLISQGLVQPRKIITAKGWITLFELTQKGKTTLRDLGYEVKDLKEGIIHKFWKQKIAEHYNRKGFKVLVEEDINGRPDIIAINGAKRIAVEIETGKSDYIRNIKRALDAGFDQIISVATNRNIEEKIRQEIQTKRIISKRVTITSASKFRG